LPVTTYCWTENKLAEISSSLKQPGQIQKKITANQNQLSSQLTWLKTAILEQLPQVALVAESLERQQSHKTSIRNHMMLIMIRWNPEHRRLPEDSGSIWNQPIIGLFSEQ